MALSLGRKLGIRSMVYVAGKPIPFFWPMRSFIHHNPLHGLEHLPFASATRKAQKLFHARTYLSRSEYQAYLAQGKIDRETLLAGAAEIADKQERLPGIDLRELFARLLTESGECLGIKQARVSGEALKAALQETVSVPGSANLVADLEKRLREIMPPERPLYESVDLLFGTDIGAELDELVIKSCLDFFDEGQSVWEMPARKQGFFRSWSGLTCRNRWLSRRARFIHGIVEAGASAEGVIEQVMELFAIPESRWLDYFIHELSRLHGWAGFIRWRENAKHYYWGNQFPGDLVDYLAVRLVLSAALLDEHKRRTGLANWDDLERVINDRSCEMFLRQELHGGNVYPPMAQQVEEVIAHRDQAAIERLCVSYLARKQSADARRLATRLSNLLASSRALSDLSADQLEHLLQAVRLLEEREGDLWLRAMEEQAMRELLENVSPGEMEIREKRPFAQALFCIDTRSERIRRHLEAVGDYQTFGIAGFFGVPFSFMELGKGSENYLCPILLTPKNLVLEMSRAEFVEDEAAVTALEKAMHELKESVLTPFVTVEAIGLLFGFDMLGKTLAPTTYNRWRRQLHQAKPATYLLQDKLSRDQADSVVRAVQRTVIENAVEHELGLPKERITDDMVRELRERALEHADSCPNLQRALAIDEAELSGFIERLQGPYRINAAFARLQLERLGRIGFSLEEQAGFVSQALRSIGLTRQFSRFVVLIGHGSSSENNPYESALDCGACGGNHGLVNARVLAQMANKPGVRARLREQGLDIDDDVCFVPAMHNTTTDEISLHDLDLLPSSHLVYLDRLRNGLSAASRLCAQERVPELMPSAPAGVTNTTRAYLDAQRNAMDWSQVRPEWGLSRNAYFIIGRRDLTRHANLAGRSFLHSYDYRADPRRRLLENILGGPLVVGQWINMEHYFSTVDNDRFGSGSKVYHNVAGRFGVMNGNLSDLRTGLPAQTVLKRGVPYHEPMRLITVIQAPLNHAVKAIDSVAPVRRLVRNEWIRMLIIDPQTGVLHRFQNDQWVPEPITADDKLTQLVEA